MKKSGGACAKPKCRNKSITIEDLTPVTERIVLNMLDRLLIKCNNCGTMNIQRGAFEKHLAKSCPKALVTCPAADLKCSWTGSTDQLKQHLIVCAYEQIRPILLEMMQENRELKEQIQQISEQCVEHHAICLKELQETNQRLNTSVKQLEEVLQEERNQMKEFQNEVQQLRELIMQDKNQMNEIQTENQREKAEVSRIDERCNKHETQINQLTDTINAKRGRIPSLSFFSMISFISFCRALYVSKFSIRNEYIQMSNPYNC